MNLTLTERMREASLIVFHSPQADTQLRNRIRSSLGNYLNQPLPQSETQSPIPSGDEAELPLLDEEEQYKEKPQLPPYPVDLLKNISQYLLKHGDTNEIEIEKSKYWFHELVKGSTVYIEPQPKRSKSQELDNRLKQLETDQQNREYYQMVASVDPNFAVDATPNPNANSSELSEWNELKGQLTAIFNILFSAVAVFAAGYWISRTLTDDTGLRILFGFLAALVVVGAETFLYVRHISSNSTSSIRNF